jgi:hypothetical protein
MLQHILLENNKFTSTNLICVDVNVLRKELGLLDRIDGQEVRQVIFEQDWINIVRRVAAAVVQAGRLDLHSDGQVEEVIEEVLERGQQHRT